LTPLLRRGLFLDEALDVLRFGALDVDFFLPVVDVFRLGRFVADFFRLDVFAVDLLRVGRLVEDFELRLLAADFFVVEPFRVRLFAVDLFEVGFLAVDFFRVGRLLDVVFLLGGVRPAASAALSLTVADTSPALSSAISCILSATVPTRFWAVSLARSFLPASVTDSVKGLRLGMEPPSATWAAPSPFPPSTGSRVPYVHPCPTRALRTPLPYVQRAT
jgi:hypothetical protein